MLGSRTQPLADLVIDAEVARWDRWLQYAEGQIHALRAAAPLIAAMPPPDVARQVARLADRLGLDHATVTEAVTDALPDIVATGRVASAPETAAPQRRHRRPDRRSCSRPPPGTSRTRCTAGDG